MENSKDSIKKKPVRTNQKTQSKVAGYKITHKCQLCLYILTINKLKMKWIKNSIYNNINKLRINLT